MRKLCIGTIVVVAALIYYFFSPTDSSFFPKCPFLLITGLKCPGCGSQRAIHALLHLDLGAAFRYNALLIVTLPLILALGYAELKRNSHPNLYVKIHNLKLIWGYFFLTIGWWIGRNLFDV